MDRIPVGKKRSIAVPRSWDDLTARQMETLADISAHEMTAPVLRLVFALSLTGMRVKERLEDGSFSIRRGLRKVTLSSEELCGLALTQSYILEKDEDSKGKNRWLIVSRRVLDPYPHLKGWSSPGDALEHLSYEQFMYALFYEQQLKDDSSKLSFLLACLWHRGRKFDAEGIEKQARRIARLPWQRRQAMLWYWTGCKQFLKGRFPRVFRPSGSGPSRNIFEDQLRVVDALSQGDMTRKPKVREGFLYDALFSMDESLRRQEEMEDRLRRP